MGSANKGLIAFHKSFCYFKISSWNWVTHIKKENCDPQVIWGPKFSFHPLHPSLAAKVGEQAETRSERFGKWKVQQIATSAGCTLPKFRVALPWAPPIRNCPAGLCAVRLLCSLHKPFPRFESHFLPPLLANKYRLSLLTRMGLQCDLYTSWAADPPHSGTW